MDKANSIQHRIIDFPAEEARLFFMEQESFCNISLPRYFNFQSLLDMILKKLDEGKFSNFKSITDSSKPQNYPDVNYKFFQNKDGRFSWRPLQIINPVIYVCLVKYITEQNNWQLITNRFKDFEEIDNIKCYSIPEINLSHKSQTAETVLSWWDNIEQQSIELSMDYSYLMITDIADCYGSIYTHSITWAMCGKENAKKILLAKQKDRTETVNNNILDSLSTTIKNQYDLGNAIDEKIRAMSYSQTNGIPQGSILMDFIAELILGYVDLNVSKHLSNDGISNYKILRYRDDYRIFGKTQEDVIKITKILTEELSLLNFKLNTQKTILTQDIVYNAIKSDKLYYITHDYKRLEEPDNHYTLQKHLLCINQFAQEHPNSGALQKAMGCFLKRICEWKNIDLFKEAEASKVLISIATNIAYNNPKVYKLYVGIVGKILSYETDINEKNKIVNKILNKFNKLPNVGYLELWLQRLTIKDNRKKEYSEELCKYVADGNSSIWNVNWLKKELKDIFTLVSFVDEDAISQLTEPTEYEEFESFNKY